MRPTGCRTGKRRFRDRMAAETALAEIARKDDQSRPKTEARAYHCPTCCGFHLTSNARPR